MEYRNKITFLSFLIAVLSAIAALNGIFSSGGPGVFEFESIRGETILIYGEGIYKHMSAEVAIQGIAQDYITLFVGIPLLIISLFMFRRGSVKAKFVLSGTLGYFFVTYLFYLIMGMYNYLFLVYAALLGASFFALAYMLLSFEPEKVKSCFDSKVPVKIAGGFLIFNAVIIGILWLSIVVPPLLDGSLYPSAVEHYTTLIVQGMDLGLLLPISIFSGYQLYRKNAVGYVLGPVFLVFLTLLMTALVAKLIYMGIEGYNIIPPIFIIPVFASIAGSLSFWMIKNIMPSALME